MSIHHRNNYQLDKMKKKRFTQLWLTLTLALVVLASCSKGAHTEPLDAPAPAGEPITLSLSAEIGFEEGADDFRALTFKIEEVNGKKIPRPQFTDGEEVTVYTILRSTASTVPVVQPLTWEYVASKKKLQIKQIPANDIEVSNFHNEGGVKWYVAGMLAPGGTLSGLSTLRFEGTRALYGIDPNAGVPEEFSLKVPYWFGWTEVTIETRLGKDGNNSYREAFVYDAQNVRFKPLGTLIAYKLGNKLSAGAYSFTPSGFVVSSNAWADQGEFNLNPDIPSTNPQNALPAWSTSSGQVSMNYTFASGYTVPTIAHNATDSKVYYAWVMPTTVPTPPAVYARIKVNGTSSRPESSTYKDYTRVYYTDYIPTGNRPKMGKIQSLRFNATRRLALPIEYITDYNLAGGGLLSSITNVPSAQQASLQGALRFSTSHRNDESGYYNWYEVAGVYHDTYNPTTRNLGNVVNSTWPDTYFIPDIDHCWGIWGYFNVLRWDNQTESLDKQEYFQLGYGSGVDFFHTLSDYSRGFTDPLGGTDVDNNAVIYAIRFRAVTLGESISRSDVVANAPDRVYYPLVDNSLKCAYRFTRVGGKTLWTGSIDNSSLDNVFRIDVVYLGEADFKEAGKTELETISNQDWWDAATSSRLSKGLVQKFSHTFSVSGFVTLSDASSGALRDRGMRSPFWSASAYVSVDARRVDVDGYSMDALYSWGRRYALPVRLFKRDPDQ